MSGFHLESYGDDLNTETVEKLRYNTSRELAEAIARLYQTSRRLPEHKSRAQKSI